MLSNTPRHGSRGDAQASREAAPSLTVVCGVDRIDGLTGQQHVRCLSFTSLGISSLRRHMATCKTATHP